jgi:hypothetical protein
VRNEAVRAAPVLYYSRALHAQSSYTPLLPLTYTHHNFVLYINTLSKHINGVESAAH